MSRVQKLFYKKPALRWNEALPLGNGRLGAYVYGGLPTDRVSLNLDTLWSGSGAEKESAKGLPDWEKIRKLIFSQQLEEAEKEIHDQVLGDWAESYLPAGTLTIGMAATEEAQKEVRQEAQEDAQSEATGEMAGYERTLVLNQGLYHNSWDGIEKEMFVSLARNLLAIRIRRTDGQKLKLDLGLDSPLLHQVTQDAQNGGLTLTGRGPVFCAPHYHESEERIRYEEGKGIQFQLSLRVQGADGVVAEDEKGLHVESGEEVILYLSGGTDFLAGEDGSTALAADDSWRRAIAETLEQTAGSSYDALKEEHVRLFGSYFDRTELWLGGSGDEGDAAQSEGVSAAAVQSEVVSTAAVQSMSAAAYDELPTDQRLHLYQQNRQDLGLVTLMFQYGRYLMIAASAPGSQCTNLQGIWNEQVHAPWCANYTVNINTEMNYWMAESCNLSEFHQPLFDLMKRIARQGEKTAKELYGLEGWTSHHNADLWGHSDPVGGQASNPSSCTFGMWNMSAGWCCRHLWEHYCYTLDRDFLEKEAFPLVEGAVRFYLGYLQPWGENMVTIPATSPENSFIGKDGKKHAVYMASTMDISILKELFSDYLEMCEVLGREGLRENVQEALKKLPDFQIGAHGQLQEWLEDFEESEVTHRHVSHLYGLYPANIISKEEEELRKACARVLDRRSDDGSGWCIAWKACLWARLGRGDRALDLLNNQMRPTQVEHISSMGGGTYSNLFCAHPPFQIDGNFGFSAAVTEMLLQSQDGELALLPALSENWSAGSVRGLKARGGFEVDFSWKDRRITRIKVRAQRPCQTAVRYDGQVQKLCFEADRLTAEIAVG